MQDTYKCITSTDSESIFKDKGSKFIGYAFYVENEDNVKTILSEIKKKHHAARHHCYAYKIGIEDIKTRFNDDGEPSHSAGEPILGQITAKDLSNILIVVVRYFGGVKLGVGGLIRAYKTAAKDILDKCKIETKTIDKKISVIFEYKDINIIMRFIKDNKLNIIEKKIENSCKIIIAVRKNDADIIFSKLNNIHVFKTSIV